MQVKAQKRIRSTRFHSSVSKWPYIFLFPYIVLYLVFFLFPIFFTFGVSFTDWNGFGEMNFVGLANYKNIFITDPYFLKSIGNTLLIMVCTLPILLIVPMLLANILYGRNIICRRFFQTTVFMPYITTPVAIGVLFALLFDMHTGVVNRVLNAFGIITENIPWLFSPILARVVVIILLVWKNLGYYVVFYMAGMSAIPEELYDAASVDGADAIQTFFSITIPQLKNTIVFLTITGIINGFQLLEEPMLLFESFGAGGASSVGGPERAVLTTVWYMYDTAFGSTFHYGKGSAIAYGLFIFIAFFSVIGFKITNRGDKQR